MTKVEYAFLLYRAERIEQQTKEAEAAKAEDFLPSRSFLTLLCRLDVLVTFQGDKAVLELRGNPDQGELVTKIATLFYGAPPGEAEVTMNAGKHTHRFEGPRPKKKE